MPMNKLSRIQNTLPRYIASIQFKDFFSPFCVALFQFYAETDRGGHDSGACMNQRALRNLLTDLQQVNL